MNEPKIVLFDIEILPDLKKALKYWTQLSSKWGRPKTMSASASSICCIGWKVLGEAETHCINLWDFPEWETDVNNDRPVLAAFLEVVRNADCVVTHYGKGFDFPYVQTKLLQHDLELIDSEMPHVDTKQAAGKFCFINNKLQTLGEELFGERKLEHEGWDLWVKTHEKDPEACNTMTAYCKQDVNLLEKVFKKFRPLIKGLPNHNLFKPYAARVCPKCGSTRLHSHGIRVSKTKRYQRYFCNDCGSTSRTDINDELPR